MASALAQANTIEEVYAVLQDSVGAAHLSPLQPDYDGAWIKIYHTECDAFDVKERIYISKSDVALPDFEVMVSSGAFERTCLEQYKASYDSTDCTWHIFTNVGYSKGGDIELLEYDGNTSLTVVFQKVADLVKARVAELAAANADIA